MQIQILKQYDVEQDITVQVFEDGVLIDCNHAGKELDTDNWEVNFQDRVEIGVDIIYRCDKDNCDYFELAMDEY